MYLELAENGETVPGAQQYVPVETNQGVLNVRADIVPIITGATPVDTGTAPTPINVVPGGIWYTMDVVKLFELPNITSNVKTKFDKHTQLELEPGIVAGKFRKTVAAPGTGLDGYILMDTVTQRQPVIVPTGPSAVALTPAPAETPAASSQPLEPKTAKNRLTNGLLLAALV